MSNFPIQTETSECGLACVAICLDLHGAPIELRVLRSKFGTSTRGATLRDIIDICAAVDMTTRSVRCEISELGNVALPAIIHWRFNHYVVLKSYSKKGGAIIIDPARGEYKPDAAELSGSFTGVLLETSPAPGFRKNPPPPQLSLWSLFSFRGDLAKSLVKVFILSIFLQMYVIGSPFFMQLAIDDAALKSDVALLTTLAIGFALFAVFNSAAEWMRTATVQYANAVVGWQMTSRLFHHMLRLPFKWFHSRRLADALTRFDSIEPIKALVAGGLVTVVFDGVLAITLLGLMFYYSPLLAGVALGAVIVSAAIKLGSVRPAISLAMNSLQASIEEKGKRIETLRSMQTIKLLGGEARRESDWLNKFGDSVLASQKTALLAQGIRVAQALVDGLAGIAVIYVGAKSVIAGTLSLGMLYAFVSYRQQFSSRMLTLMDQVVAWRLLEMHSFRLSDIALEPREEGLDGPARALDTVKGSISLKQVAFRYSPHDPLILKDLNFEVDDGEFVAIVGASGGGKSTLLKLLTGLYVPVAGSLEFGGTSTKTAGLRQLRSCIGAVLQDDDLLSGSLIDNVTFFDEDPDEIEVWRCLEAAAIASEVRSMPMQLNTLVGDLGSGLSGGQKQRLLLARALYRKPKILILDEATSNLDPKADHRVHDNLRSLKMTRIVVTHRPETARLADKVYVLESGKLRQLPVSARHEASKPRDVA